MPPAPTDAPTPATDPTPSQAPDDLTAASDAPPGADDEAAASRDDDREAPVRRPRKARKKKPTDEPYRAAEAAADTSWRPAFARHYPRHPELDRLLRCFLDGDFATVHREAPQLAGRVADPDVARAARDLRRRLDPDRLSLGLLAMMAALLLFLVLWFYSHRYHGH